MNADTVADRRLHAGTVPLRFLKDAPSTVLGLPALAGVMSDIGWQRVLIGAAAIAAITLAIGWLSWRSFRYGVGARDIVIERGMINRSRRVIPFDRIQDVNVERGPLARLFGLAKLKIETGGADKDEGALDSVSLAEAERLRAALKAGQGATLAGAHEAADPVLFAMALPRVLLSGVFNFSLAWLAGIVAALQTFSEALPFSPSESWRAAKIFWTDSLGYVPPLLIAATLLPILLALTVVIGVARSATRDYGFTLSLATEGFRRRRGLFTKSEVTIPRHRVQLGLVKAGPLPRALGWWSLNLQTMGGEKAEGGKQAVAPFAREAEFAPILAEAQPLRLPAPETLLPVSRRYLVKALIERAPVSIVLIAGVAIFPLALPALLLIPLLVVSAFLERRAHRYALDGDMLFVQRGFLSRKLWLVPAARAQAITIKQSWLQRRLGTATLLVDTAGASALSDPRIVDIKVALAEELSAAIAMRVRG